jgi:transposase-like protein
MTNTAKMTLPKLMDAFDTDAECRQILEELRWPTGVVCLRCGSESISRIKTRKQYDCNACRYRFSVTTGTIFNDSHLALPKWFMAVLLMCEAKKGISANQMRRTLGVAAKTAWYLCHRIREAMLSDMHAAKLAGTVEVDETYVGGHRPMAQGRNPRENKAVVMGAVERNGRISLRHAANGSHAEIRRFVHDAVSKSAARIITDEHAAYRGLNDDDTQHESVNHGRKEYVRPGTDIHTNTIEGAFGLFKRGLVGSFHQVSHKHLDRYLDEFEFKYNNRKNAFLFRETLTRLVTTNPLQYDTLTA